MEGYTNFPKESFSQHINTFYPLAVDLLSRDLNSEIRPALQSLLRRVGEVMFGLPVQSPPEQPPSPGQQYINTNRRNSGGH
jgi:brefeldin A-inhibited guanine nucleotide-exchange protein